MQILRKIAFKFWIKQIIDAQLISEENGNDYFLISNNKVNRINLMASVTQRYDNKDKNYSYISLDDGYDIIRVKAWGEDLNLLSDIKIGDIVNIIARIRRHNDETYLTPEIVKLINDPKWLLARNLDLTKIYGKPNTAVKPVSKEESSFEEGLIDAERVRQRILELIEQLDNGNGADTKSILSLCNIKSAESTIKDLLKEGEIFEISGKLKITG